VIQGNKEVKTVDKAVSVLIDLFIIVAAIVLIIGIISRMTLNPILGIEAQAFLQFAQALLLFAIAGGIRQLLRK